MFKAVFLVIMCDIMKENIFSSLTYDGYSGVFVQSGLNCSKSRTKTPE